MSGELDPPARQTNRFTLPVAGGLGSPRGGPGVWGRKCARDARAALAQALAHRRLIVLIAFAVICGLLLYRLWPHEPPLVLHVCAFGAAASGLILARKSLTGLRLGALAMATMLGFSLLPLHGALFGTAMLGSPLYGAWTGHVEAVLRDDGQSMRLLLSDLTSIEDDEVVPVRYARVALRERVALAAGDTITGRMRFYPVPAPIVPGGYDAQFVGYFAGIGAYGSAFGTPEVTPGARRGVGGAIDTIRRAIGVRMVAALNERIGGIATALVTGDQSRLRESDREIMATAGLAHILAISGLHLTLVAGSIYTLTRGLLALAPRLGRFVAVKKIAAGAGLATAIAYMLISGMGVPAIRATLMLGLVFLAVMAGRRALTMRNVALAALCVLVIDPTSVFGASFQLSFAAVVALIAGYELVAARADKRPQSRQRSWLVRTVSGIVLTSAIAGTATTLFTAYHFQQTAPFGLLANVLAMPIVTFVLMPAAVLSVVLMPFGLEGLTLPILGAAIEQVLAIAGWVNRLAGGFDPSPLLAPHALIILAFGFAWLAFFQTRVRLAGPLLAVPLALSVGLAQRPDVLIADNTQAIALRTSAGLMLVSGRNGTFATNVWSERYMEPITTSDRDAPCDEIGCVFDTDAFGPVAVPEHPAAAPEDCRSANLVIARFELPRACQRHAQTIDRWDLARGGAQALYWQDQAQRFEIRPTIAQPGRPWRAAHAL